MQTSPPASDSPRPKTNLHAALRHGAFLLLEKLLRWCVHPHLRARLIGICGAHVGINVRIYEIQLFNLQYGFRSLELGDNVHIGPGCRLDLSAPIRIGMRSTLSPGVTVLTHNDPGSTHGSRLLGLYPRRFAPVTIGADCWIGANVTLLAGVTVEDLCIIGAGAVVTRDIKRATVVAGVPARCVKRLPFED